MFMVCPFVAVPVLRLLMFMVCPFVAVPVLRLLMFMGCPFVAVPVLRLLMFIGCPFVAVPADQHKTLDRTFGGEVAVEIAAVCWLQERWFGLAAYGRCL